MKRFLLFSLIGVCSVLSSYSQMILHEDFSSGILPVNWTESSVSSGDSWEYGGSVDFGSATVIPDATGIQGEYAHIDFSDDPDTTALITPGNSITGLTNPRLTFFYISQTTSTSFNPYNRLIVDYWDGSAWVNITVIDTLTTAGWTKYEFNISSFTYNTDSVKFRFAAQEGGSAIGGTGTATYDQDMALDEVVIEETPTCPKPSALNSSNLTATSVDLDWIENGSATTWQVIYDTAGFATGTARDTIITSNNPESITGLMPATTYDYYVRSICAPGDTSAWSFSNTFSTPCTPISVPLTETFNSNSTTQSCWTIVNNNNDGDTWDMDDTYDPYEGDEGVDIYTDFNGGNNDDYLISPTITLTGGERLRYYVRSRSTGEPNNYEVLISTTGTPVTNFSDTLLRDTVATTSYVERMIDLSAYSTDVNVAFHVPQGSLDGYYLYIDSVNFEAIPSCLTPNSLTTSNVTSNSIDLDWVENGSATQWEIIYDTTGFTVGTARDTVLSTSKPTSISGLLSNTSYDWYVRSICGAGDTSAWSSVNTFTTSCPAISSFPYTEDFDGRFINGTWDCWTVINADNDNETWIQDDIYISPRSGAWTAHGMGNNDDHLISPQFSIPAGMNMRMKIWDIVESSNYPNDYSILVSTTGTDISNFTDTLASYSVTNTSWTERTVDLSAYAGMDINISFWQSYSAATYFGFGLDDFTFEEIPACVAPTANAVSAITDTSATFSWIENGTATEYYVEYDTAGFAVGTGRNKVTVTTDTFLTVNGLSSRTQYDWYVKAVCGRMDSSLNASGTFSTAFFTPAAGVNCGAGLPQTIFSEEFDNNNAGWTGDVNSGNSSWEIPDGATSSNTGADNAHSGANYMNFEASATTTNQGSIVSPAIDLTQGSQAAELSFWLHAYGQTMGTLNVGIGTSATGPFTTEFTTTGQVQTSGSDPWQNVGVDLTSYIGQTIYIQFTQIDDNNSAGGSLGYDGDMSIDLVEVTTCITCPAPSNLSASSITSNSADLSWTENGSASSWVVEYGPTGFTPGNGTVVVSSNDTLNLTGLNTYSTNDFYVQADCGMMDSSSLVGPYTFTVGLPLAGPYTIDSSMVTGGTNFQSFSDFSRAINSFGVSAAVDVTVASNTYNDELSIGEILGASSTNTVTINGVDKTAHLVHDGSVRNSTITLEGASWLTIKNMTIEATGTSDAWGVLLKDSSHNILLDSNHILMVTGSNSDVAGVIVSNSETSDASQEENAFNLTISNSRIIGGERGVTLYGDITDRNMNFTILNNEILYAADYGIYTSYLDTLTIHNNIIDSLINSAADAIYLSDLENFTVTSNYLRAEDNALDADDLNYDNPVTVNSTIANNFLLGGDDAMYLDDIENIDIFHNSTAAEDYGVYINDHANLDIRNNIFASNSDDAFYCLDSAAIVLDYNIYVSNGTGDLIRFGGTAQSYADLATFQAAAPSLNVNSLQGNPLYIDNYADLHVTGTIANDVGDNSVGITVDIDGDSRPLAPSTTVDIGADEYTPASCLLPLNLVANNISATSVDLSWTERNSATTWEVSYGPFGFTAGNGTEIIVTSNPYPLTGLSASTTYDFYIRSICSSVDTSAWSSVTSFATLCAPFTATYSQNFDAVIAPELANCWSAIEPSATTIQSVTSTDQSAPIPSGPNAIEINNSSGNDVVLVSPEFTDLPTGSNRISFQFAAEGGGTTFHDTILVGVMTNPTLASSFTPIDTLANAQFSGTGFVNISIDLDNTSLIGSATHIGFMHLQGNGGYEFYIDDFLYEPMPNPYPYYPIGTINTEDANGDADSINVQCSTSGTIVAFDRRGGGYEFTIVDMSSSSQEGITVFNSNNLAYYTNPQVGDSVNIWGSISQFNGLTQIGTDSINLISTNATIPTPLVSNVLNESTESILIQMTDKFVLLDGSQTGSFNMDAVSVSNPTDTITVRVDSQSDIDDSLAVAPNPWVVGDTICGLVGVGGQYDFTSPYLGDYQVFPNSWNDIIICRNTTAINEVAENVNLAIFPNPTTSGEFTIQTSGLNNNNAMITVRDISGKVVIRENIANSNSAFTKSYNVNSQAKGLYFISIIDGENTYNQKLIVQ